MKYIVVDRIAYEDLPFAARLPAEAKSVVSVIARATESLFDIAARVNSHLSPVENALILINVNLTTDRFSSNDQAGADLLTLLRLADDFDSDPNRARQLPIIAYSVFQLEDLLREKPGNLIFLSEGTGFLHLGSGEITPDIEVLFAQRFDVMAWAQSVKSAAFIPENSHDMANWWGIRQLARVHALVTNQELELSVVVREKMKERAALSAAAQYGFDNGSLAEAFQGHNQAIIDLRALLLKRTPPLKILHIDDEWQNGWSEMFLKILYPTGCKRQSDNDSDRYYAPNNGKFVVFKGFPTTAGHSALVTMCERIRQIIVAEDCRLVLLDLRLFKETDSLPGVGRLSGSEVLKYLRSTFPGLPVIMTTASNKAWSIEKLLKNGADGYWIKEGVDKRNTAEESVRNYLRLLELVEKASGNEYHLLLELSNLVLSHAALQRGGKWYSSKRWADGSQTSLDSEDTDMVSDILIQSVALLRAYLHLTIMGYGPGQPSNIRFWFASIIRHASGIHDLVHKVPNDPELSIGRIMYKRKDATGLWINKIRNQVSHPDYIGKRTSALPDWEMVRDYYVILLAYLIHGPIEVPREIDPRKESKYKAIWRRFCP